MWTREGLGRSYIYDYDADGERIALKDHLADSYRFTVGGFSNEDLCLLLADDIRSVNKTDKQRSAMTTRFLRLLGDQDVIRQLAEPGRNHLTSRGRQLVTTLRAALAASAEEPGMIAA